MDQELKAYLDQRFERIDQRFERIDERFAQVDERFERVETEARQTRVLLEAMHGNIGLLTEGVVGTNERIFALREETQGSLAEIKGSIDAIPQAPGPPRPGLGGAGRAGEPGRHRGPPREAPAPSDLKAASQPRHLR